MSDVTLHVSTTPLTVKDLLLMKASQTEKDWIVENEYFGENRVILLQTVAK